jgi:chemotaxis protein MotA
MDIMSIIGLVLSIFAIIAGQWLEGGHLGSLANGSALVIVFGGTFGAVIMQTPRETFLEAMRRLPWIFVPPPLSFANTLDDIEHWCETARRNGLLSLEQFTETETDAFSRKGLMLLLDGNEPEVIRRALEVDISTREATGLRAAKFYEGMSGYAPTIGIIGAVIGLIHVMENLSDPGRLGSGIAAAFVATIYGVASANLLYLPIANKLRAISEQQARHAEMVTEGVVGIAEGMNPLTVRVKLEGFVG